MLPFRPHPLQRHSTQAGGLALAEAGGEGQGLVAVRFPPPRRSGSWN